MPLVPTRTPPAPKPVETPTVTKIEPYWKSECGRAVIYKGDCREVMKQLDAESVSSVVSDPPYGIEFMNKEFDAPWKHQMGSIDVSGMSDSVGFQLWFQSCAVEIFRVAKPGAHMLAFGGCYDKSTEVLTKRGWIAFSDVTSDDEFASLNLDNHMVEWQRSLEIVVKKHEGPMVQYKTNRIDLLVTPNHNMLVSRLGSYNYKLERADTHSNAVKMTKTSMGVIGDYETEILIPAVCQGKGHGHVETLPEVRIPFDDWMKFFGLWIAEGSACVSKRKRGECYSTDICHFTVENTRHIEQVMSKYFSVCTYKGRLRIYDKRLTKYLMQFGHAQDKFVPMIVKNASPEHIRLFLEWYARGDGDSEGRIYTCSSRLCDDVQEISMYAGWAADWSVVSDKKKNGSINGREIVKRRVQYVIRLLKSQTTPEIYHRKGKKPSRTLVPSSEWDGGNVYCVELPRHHTLYVRRNGKAVWCGNTRMFHRLVCGVEDAGFEVRDIIMWVYSQGFPKSHNVSVAIDKAYGVEREIVGTRIDGKRSNSGSGCYQMNDGVDTSMQQVFNATAPATADAVKWNGWGTALKPSLEPIVVARKPLIGTVAQNVLEHGTGGINIDGCRVGVNGGCKRDENKAGTLHKSIGNLGNSLKGSVDGTLNNGRSPQVENLGRWPANLLHDNSAEAIAGFPETGPSTSSTSNPRPAERHGTSLQLNTGKSAWVDGLGGGYDDNGGSAARYFYSPKASGEERDNNNHPTVKPVDLMCYLVRLVTAKDHVVLDPFMGSGSTGVAAIEEGCRFIGIEQDEKYCDTAIGRIRRKLIEKGYAKDTPPPARTKLGRN